MLNKKLHPFILFTLAECFALLISIVALKINLKMQLYFSAWIYFGLQFLLFLFFQNKIFKLPVWFSAIGFFFTLGFYWSFNSHFISAPVAFFIWCLLVLLMGPAMIYRVPLYFTHQKGLHELGDFIALKKATTLIDLGSGTGRVLHFLHAHLTKHQISFKGVELAWLPFLFSQLRFLNTRAIKIKHQSLFEVELKNFEIIYAYLSPAVMEELEEKLERELIKGQIFISNCFPLPRRKPQEIIECGDRMTKLFIYYF